MIHEFSGTAAERGRQHGRRLRDQIRARIAGSLPPGSAAARAGLAGPWLAAIDALEHRAPLGAELRGIAAGAGAALPDIVLLNAFEAVEVARQVELGGCTAVALAGPAGAVLAQNWDANPSLAGSVAIHLHRGPDIRTTVLVASPGGLGWIGMSAGGVALVNNDLLTRAVRPGVPSQAVRRYALAAGGAAEAVAAVLATPAVGGRAYLIADAAGAVNTVELAAETGPRVGRHGTTAAHTNHALDPAIARYEDPDLLAAIYPSSRSRLRRASQLLAEALAGALAGTGPADPVRACRRILADHTGYPLSICRHPADQEPTVTAASVIFDCARRQASIALGTGCGTAYQEIPLA
ncbi:MAG TPA: C45 family peptidase [Mycobacteriales bacterium]|nr:C45 family peptidase [Mycobacteriales bacterium]